MAKKKKVDDSLLAKNKKAHFSYEILETIECGIALKGTEVKSLRLKQFSFTDAFVEILHDEIFLKKFYIAHFLQGSIFNHIETRHRKLLLNRKEIDHLQKKVKEKGMTLIPLKVYLKRHLIKVEIGLCRGKKLYDKRESIKAKDLKRENDRLRSRITKGV